METPSPIYRKFSKNTVFNRRPEMSDNFQKWVAKIRVYFWGNIMYKFVYKLVYKLVSSLVKKDVDYPCPFYVFCFVLFLGFCFCVVFGFYARGKLSRYLMTRSRQMLSSVLDLTIWWISSVSSCLRFTCDRVLCWTTRCSLSIRLSSSIVLSSSTHLPIIILENR